MAVAMEVKNNFIPPIMHYIPLLYNVFVKKKLNKKSCKIIHFTTHNIWIWQLLLYKYGMYKKYLLTLHFLIYVKRKTYIHSK